MTYDSSIPGFKYYFSTEYTMIIIQELSAVYQFQNFCGYGIVTITKFIDSTDSQIGKACLNLISDSNSPSSVWQGAQKTNNNYGMFCINDYISVNFDIFCI